jgi:tetratricopeptide (TPR) repeat protein
MKLSAPAIPKNRWISLGALGIIIGAVSSGVFLGKEEFGSKKVVEAATTYFRNGNAFHAADLIDHDRKLFSQSREGCKVALLTFTQVRKLDSLGWMIEACISTGFQDPELYLAQASLHENYGDPNAALDTLTAAAAKYPGVSAFYVKMAEIYSIHNRLDRAKASWIAATDQDPKDLNLAMKALHFFYDHAEWSESRALANVLRSSPAIAQPEKLFFVASALERSGDSIAALQARDRALGIIGHNEGLRKHFAQRYPELFSKKIKDH